VTTTEAIGAVRPVVDETASDAFTPDDIVPFAIAEVDARQRALRWIRRTRLPPFRLGRLAKSGAIEERYLPFWAFDAHAIGYWSGGGVMRGIIEMDFCNLLISAERSIESSAMPELESPLAKSIRAYDQRLVAGRHVATAPRRVDEATLLAHARIERELAAEAWRSRPPKERSRMLLSRVEYARETSKRLLLPVWLLEYRYLGRNYCIAVDGASGRVVGQVPASVAKVGLVAIAALWLMLFLGDAETALSIPERMAEGVRWLLKRSS
jgi:hypothetical protein